MRLVQRIYGHFQYGHGRYPAGCRIQCDGHTLFVENRQLYSSYLLYHDGEIVLRHDVRTPEPLPIRPAQIIHARHIPWFMWIYYGISDLLAQWRFNRVEARWQKENQQRREAMLRAVKDRGLGRFGGRYNR